MKKKSPVEKMGAEKLKKVMAVAIAVLLLAVLTAGCGSGGQKSGGSSGAESQSSSGGSASPPAQADSGERRLARPDLMGQVDSISGSEITLKTIEMPDFAQENGGVTLRTENGQGQGEQKPQPDNNGSSQGQDGQGALTDSSGSGQSGNGQGSQTDGSSGQGPAQGQNDNRHIQGQFNYTGETKTINITDEATITTFDRGNNGDNGGQPKTIALTDIKVGDILQIWFSDENKTTVSRVMVMPSAENN